MHPADRIVHEIGAHFEHQIFEGFWLQPVAFSKKGFETPAWPSEAEGWTILGMRDFFNLPKELPALPDMRVALLALTGISRRFRTPCSVTCPDHVHFEGTTPEALFQRMRTRQADLADPKRRAEIHCITRDLERCLSAHGRLALAEEVGPDPNRWLFLDSSKFTN